MLLKIFARGCSCKHVICRDYKLSRGVINVNVRRGDLVIFWPAGLVISPRNLAWFHSIFLRNLIGRGSNCPPRTFVEQRLSCSPSLSLPAPFPILESTALQVASLLPVSFFVAEISFFLLRCLFLRKNRLRGKEKRMTRLYLSRFLFHF